MKNKMLRFAVYSVGMIGLQYLAFMLLDMKNGNASEKAGENLLLAVIVGLAASASLGFFTNSLNSPKYEAISRQGNKIIV